MGIPAAVRISFAFFVSFCAWLASSLYPSLCSWEGRGWLCFDPFHLPILYLSFFFRMGIWVMEGARNDGGELEDRTPVDALSEIACVDL